MDEAVLLEVGRDAIIVTLKLGAPLMIISLLIGLIISLFQALTQIQEQTLIYVPKIVSTFLGLLVLMPFMSDAMMSYMARIAARIIAGG